MKIMHRLATTVALLLASNSVMALDANEEITPADNGYQYLVYSVTWQPSFCKLKPETVGCDQPLQKFLTHGIWPYSDGTSQKTNRHPAFCNTSPSCKSTAECEISDGALDQIVQNPQIAELVTAEPKQMFQHEWKKHGTCSGMSEKDYFSDIVNLRKVVIYDEKKFDSWVGKNVPFDELKTAFPSNTSFRCFTQANKQYLHEVFYRINADGSPYEKDEALQIGIPCKAQKTYIPGGV